MRKNRFIVLATVLFLLLFSFSVFANENLYSDETVYNELDIVEDTQSELFTDESFPLVYVDATDGGDFAESRALSFLTVGIVRSGNTQKCEVYLNWGGPDIYGGWRFSSATVDNGSFLNPVVYGTIPKKSVYPPADSIGSVKLGDVQIPAGIKRVRVKLPDLAGYNVSKGIWITSNTFNFAALIN